jgi:hypothetical protein
LHRIKLVVNGRSRAGKIENFVNLNIESETDVVAHQFKAGMRLQMMHVVSRPGVEIIDAQDFVAAFQQAIAKVRSNKSGSAGDEDTTFGQHGQSPPGVAGGESIIGVSLVADL